MVLTNLESRSNLFHSVLVIKFKQQQGSAGGNNCKCFIHKLLVCLHYVNLISVCCLFDLYTQVVLDININIMEVKRAEILGHSFVNHLRDYTFSAGYPNDFNLGVDGTRLQICFTGQSGGTVRPGKKSIQKILGDMGSPVHVIFLQIGGNNLSDEDCEPCSLAWDIVAFASFLTEAYNVKQVIIGQLYFRFSLYRCHADNNHKVTKVNVEIPRLIAG